MINNFIPNSGATDIRGLTVHWNLYVSKKKNNESLAYLVTFITNLSSTALSLTVMNPIQEQVPIAIDNRKFSQLHNL